VIWDWVGSVAWTVTNAGLLLGQAVLYHVYFGL
jgi:hypothetical protein